MAKPKRRVAKRVAKVAKRKPRAAAKRPAPKRKVTVKPARKQRSRATTASAWAESEECKYRAQALIELHSWLSPEQRSVIRDPGVAMPIVKAVAETLRANMPALQAMN